MIGTQISSIPLAAANLLEDKSVLVSWLSVILSQCMKRN